MMTTMITHTPAVTLYGIPNCSTVKKARLWLGEQGVSVLFHDFKKQGAQPVLLKKWLEHHDWETLLNRKGTTWRQLGQDAQAGVRDADSAAALMSAHPSLIKRPVIEWRSGAVTVGFNADALTPHLHEKRHPS